MRVPFTGARTKGESDSNVDVRRNFRDRGRPPFLKVVAYLIGAMIGQGEEPRGLILFVKGHCHLHCYPLPSLRFPVHSGYN